MCICGSSICILNQSWLGWIQGWGACGYGGPIVFPSNQWVHFTTLIVHKSFSFWLHYFHTCYWWYHFYFDVFEVDLLACILFAICRASWLYTLFFFFLIKVVKMKLKKLKFCEVVEMLTNLFVVIIFATCTYIKSLHYAL